MTQPNKKYIKNKPLISERKYTKTTTFLLPLLGVSKKNFLHSKANEKIITRKLLINAYLQIKNEATYTEGVIYLLLDGSTSSLVNTLLYLINEKTDVLFHKNKGVFHIVAAQVKPEYLEDYKNILIGQYSKISTGAKKALIRSSLLDEGAVRLSHILQKDPRLKIAWEELLGVSIGSQEVWPVLSIEDETLDLDTLKTNNRSNKTQNFQYELNFEPPKQQQFIEYEL